MWLALLQNPQRRAKVDADVQDPPTLEEAIEAVQWCSRIVAQVRGGERQIAESAEDFYRSLRKLDLVPLSNSSNLEPVKKFEMLFDDLKGDHSHDDDYIMHTATNAILRLDTFKNECEHELRRDAGHSDTVVEPVDMELPNIFRCENDTWTIRFAGGEIQRGIKNCKAAPDIQYILQCKDTDVAILQLPENRGQSRNTEARIALTEDKLDDINENGRGDSDSDCRRETIIRVAQPHDRIDMLRQITKLQSELDGLDKDEALNLLVRRETENEIAELRRQISQNFNIRGEPRVLSGLTDKAVHATQTRVRRFVDDRIRSKLPDLADHLDRHLTISYMCRYSPGNLEPWDFGVTG
jgi:hypothetical protein